MDKGGNDNVRVVDATNLEIRVRRRGTSEYLFPYFLGNQCTFVFFESTGPLTVLDATRISDDTPVALKLLSTTATDNTPDSNEIETLGYLSSPELAQSPRNHCIQMLDCFEIFTPVEMLDLHAKGYSNAFIAVFPFARHWKDLPFRLVWEVLEFVRQILEVCRAVRLLSSLFQRCLGSGFPPRA